MTLVRYQPWSSSLNGAPVWTRDLLSEMTDFFNTAQRGDSSSATADWTPAVDVAEYSDKFVLTADVPGIDVNAIEITLEKGVLSIAGTREKPTQDEEVHSRRVERSAGRFHRQFTLPDTADADSVSASGNNGVLEITIPKRPTEQPRRIAINTAAK